MPCTEQYNHHYSTWMHGKDAKLSGITKVGMRGTALRPCVLSLDQRKRETE